MLRPALKHRWADRGIWGHLISILAPTCLSISQLGDISDRKWEMIQTHCREGWWSWRTGWCGCRSSAMWNQEHDSARLLLLTACLTTQASDSASAKSLLTSTRSGEKNKETKRATEALQTRTDDRLTHFEEWSMVEERKTVGLAKQISMRVHSKQ